MKKKYYWIIGILVIFGIGIYSFIQQVKQPSPKQNITIPTDKESCEAQSGMWGRHYLLPKESCILLTSDAGKLCTDSDQCESACIDYKCYQWNPVPGGCYNYVENGEVKPLCID